MQQLTLPSSTFLGVTLRLGSALQQWPGVTFLFIPTQVISGRKSPSFFLSRRDSNGSSGQSSRSPHPCRPLHLYGSTVCGHGQHGAHLVRSNDDRSGGAAKRNSRLNLHPGTAGVHAIQEKNIQLRHEDVICLILLLASVMTGTVGWSAGSMSIEHIFFQVFDPAVRPGGRSPIRRFRRGDRGIDLKLGGYAGRVPNESSGVCGTACRIDEGRK